MLRQSYAISDDLQVAKASYSHMFAATCSFPDKTACVEDWGAMGEFQVSSRPGKDPFCTSRGYGVSAAGGCARVTTIAASR